MRRSAKMQEVITKIAEVYGVDLVNATPGDVYIKVPGGGAFMDLVIEKPNVNQISVAHYYSQAGDLVQDPEIVFLIGCDGKWYATEIVQPQMMLLGRRVGGHQTLATVSQVDAENGTFSSYYPRAQREAAIFANKWAMNLRAQGFLKRAKQNV